MLDVAGLVFIPSLFLERERKGVIEHDYGCVDKNSLPRHNRGPP